MQDIAEQHLQHEVLHFIMHTSMYRSPSAIPHITLTTLQHTALYMARCGFQCKYIAYCINMYIYTHTRTKVFDSLYRSSLYFEVPHGCQFTQGICVGILPPSSHFCWGGRWNVWYWCWFRGCRFFACNSIVTRETTPHYTRCNMHNTTCSNSATLNEALYWALLSTHQHM